MIIRVNFGFHGLSPGRRAPDVRWQWTDLGRSITQASRRNKVATAFASAGLPAYLRLTERVNSHECSRTAGRPARRKAVAAAGPPVGRAASDRSPADAI